VLVLGPRGSGRRTWADHLMEAHCAAPTNVWRSEERGSLGSGRHRLSADDARWLGGEYFALRTRRPRWASLELDGVSDAAANALLKTLEELPATARVILRGRPGEVLDTIRSRCLTTWLTPGSPDEEVGIILSADVDEHAAVELQELRPGRPGEAIRLAATLPLRDRADGILSACEQSDTAALAAALSDWDDGIAPWVREWVASAIVGRAERHSSLARRAGLPALTEAARLLSIVPNRRLAVRAAMTVLSEPR
jgi:hypothetical protein